MYSLMNYQIYFSVSLIKIKYLLCVVCCVSVQCMFVLSSLGFYLFMGCGARFCCVCPNVALPESPIKIKFASVQSQLITLNMVDGLWKYLTKHTVNSIPQTIYIFLIFFFLPNSNECLSQVIFLYSVWPLYEGSLLDGFVPSTPLDKCQNYAVCTL